MENVHSTSITVNSWCMNKANAAVGINTNSIRNKSFLRSYVLRNWMNIKNTVARDKQINKTLITELYTLKNSVNKSI